MLASFNFSRFSENNNGPICIEKGQIIMFTRFYENKYTIKMYTCWRSGLIV